MNLKERAQRLTAWTWAAQALGIEATSERLNGLVELTETIHVENLQPALKDAMRANPNGFLPPVHSVFQAANRIAGQRREAKQAALMRTRRDQALLSAPASRVDVQAIRDRIAQLAREKTLGGSTDETPVHGWRPNSAITDARDDSAGIAAARAAAAGRGSRD